MSTDYLRNPKPARKSLLQEAKRLLEVRAQLAHETVSPEHGRPVGRAMSTDYLRNPKPARKSLLQEAKRLLELRAQLAHETVTDDGAAGALALDEVEIEESQQSGADLEPPPSYARDHQLARDVSVGESTFFMAYNTLRRQSKESNKENIEARSRPKNFIDRQQGAQRVNFDDDSQEVFTGTRRGHGSPHKQPYNGRQDTRDDGDDFEVTNVVTANKRREQLRKMTDWRRSPEPFSPNRDISEVPDSVLFAAGADDRADDYPEIVQAARDQQSVNGAADSSTSGRSHLPPPSTQPFRAPLTSSHNSNTSALSSSSLPPSTAQQLEYLRQCARQRVATIKPRTVQVRNPYTQAEEDRLISLIEEHGISYSLIKQIDNHHPDGALLHERSQVQLKDKAQDLKFQFLKARVGLPHNFDKIPLRSRMRDQLEALGIYQGY